MVASPEPSYGLVAIMPCKCGNLMVIFIATRSRRVADSPFALPLRSIMSPFCHAGSRNRGGRRRVLNLAHSTHHQANELRRDRNGRASMKVGDVMTLDIEVLNPDDSLRTAAQLMADLDLEALPVSENNRLTGMISGRDIAIRAVAKGRGPAEITVREAMSSDVLYCFEDEPTSDIAQKMNDWWVRRLPVVNENNRLIGIVSLADATSLQAAAPTTRVVGERSQRLRAARSERRIRRNRRAAVAA